jgi:hypothetical protein
MDQTLPQTPIYRDLRAELEVIASNELGDILDAWAQWTPEQIDRLTAYLRAEMTPGGMLSVDKARDAGHSLGRERRQARAILARYAARA